MPHIPAEIYYSRTDRAPISAPIHEQLPAEQKTKLSSIAPETRGKMPRQLVGKWSLNKAPMTMSAVAREMLPTNWAKQAGKM